MNIKIRFTEQDENQVKKAFAVLMVFYEGDLEQVLQAMNQNPIAIEKSNEWIGTLQKKVELIQAWGLDKVMVRGKQCSYNDVVYNIVQTHTVTDISHTPNSTPALYRPAPVIMPGRLYPRWDSIGLLDSVNYWKDTDIVDWNGDYWQSNHATNVWQPGVSQWTKIEGIVIPPVEPPIEPPVSACENVPVWNANQHWSTYAIGDKRQWNGKLYECKSPQWAQSYEPDSVAGLQYGWTYLQDC
jgi:hypothetical protein